MTTAVARRDAPAVEATPEGIPEGEALLASAVAYLVEGQEYEAADVLIRCRVNSVSIKEDSWNHPGGMYFHLTGPRHAYDAYSEKSGRHTVDDHLRDGLFQAYGIRLVKHRDWKVCMDKPDAVVEDFLAQSEIFYG